MYTQKSLSSSLELRFFLSTFHIYLQYFLFGDVYREQTAHHTCVNCTNKFVSEIESFSVLLWFFWQTNTTGVRFYVFSFVNACILESRFSSNWIQIDKYSGHGIILGLLHSHYQNESNIFEYVVLLLEKKFFTFWLFQAPQKTWICWTFQIQILLKAWLVILWEILSLSVLAGIVRWYFCSTAYLEWDLLFQKLFAYQMCTLEHYRAWF